MRELIAKIITAPLEIQLMWLAWFIGLVVLVIITYRIINRNYKVWRRVSREKG